MKTAYLGLGSNLGDRKRFLSDAILAINSASGIRVEKISSIYETDPVGVVDQPKFLNLVVEIATTLEPKDLLASCLGIEKKLGRVRKERWGPRTIDIDVLWFGGEVVDQPELTLPHPRLKERAFVLAPLAEIAPHVLIDGESVAEFTANLDQTGVRSIGPLSA
ncbi:MAG: 2-amino-4-hydroxy-6-hydroxymethyldihydropteridine diphosphokinase [Nibricoccus sp.]